MSETYEKVRVGDLKVGDVVQLLAYIDTPPTEIVQIDIIGEIAYFMTPDHRYSRSRVPYTWSVDNLVFRVKKGTDERTNEKNHDPPGEAECG